MNTTDERDHGATAAAEPTYCPGCPIFPGPHGHYSAKDVTPMAPPYQRCAVCGEAITAPGEFACVDGDEPIHRGACWREWDFAQKVKEELSRWAHLLPDLVTS